jgi:hypothetical protein
MHAAHRRELTFRRQHGIGLVLQRLIGERTRLLLETRGEATWPAEQDAFWSAYILTIAALDASNEVLHRLEAELKGETVEDDKDPPADNLYVLRPTIDTKEQ